MRRFLLALLLGLLALPAAAADPPTLKQYFDNTGRDDVLAGGVRMIPITTPKGDVPRLDQARRQQPADQGAAAARRPGRDARVPSRPSTATCPAAGIEYYYYDQLGSLYSDQPDDPRCWELPRFVDEVEQVRQALGLDRGQLLPARPFVGRHAGDRVRAQAPGAPQGPGHLQHDGQHPGVQRVREQGADAGDGPGRAGRDQAARGRGRLRRTRATWSC